MGFKMFHGDCLDTLKRAPDNSMDSIVTDPPYGLSFMGKKWDYDVPTVDIWKECLRVLKPGGHLLAFGGTRTYHRLVVAIEDAGFEIRDQIQWLYGQGFPKSQDISKAIDKAAGAERVVEGYRHRETGEVTDSPQVDNGGQRVQFGYQHASSGVRSVPITTPATDDAKKWVGYGTALKPANEPICLARKPLSESTIAKNVLKHGTGGLNIDGTRIEGAIPQVPQPKLPGGDMLARGKDYEGRNGEMSRAEGRFPSNVILDEDAAKVLDEQVASEVSRFFYIPKVSSKERGDSTHPTMKPIKLMEYLIKLVTPEGGIVLDPFMGSGTTGVAAVRNGFQFRGIEREESYYYISQARLEKETTE